MGDIISDFDSSYADLPIPLLVLEKQNKAILSWNSCARDIFDDRDEIQVNSLLPDEIELPSLKKTDSKFQLVGKYHNQGKTFHVFARQYKDDPNLLLFRFDAVDLDLIGTKDLENWISINQALDKASIISKTDPKGIITYVNENFEGISGYSASELLGRNHNIINSDYHTRDFWLEMWKTIASGEQFRAEIRNRRKDGSFYWVDTHIIPFTDSTGKVIEYISLKNDITHRKAIEEIIVKNENHFKKLYNESPVMLLSADSLGRLVTVSDYWCKKMGYKREEAINHHYTAFLTEASQDKIINEVTPQVQKKGSCEDVEVQCVRKDGAILSGLLSATVYKDKNEEVIRSIVVITDITNYRNLEKERNRLSLIAEHTTNAVVLTDSLGYINWVNSGFEKTTGYTLEEVRDKKPGHILQGEETDARTIAAIGEALKKKERIKVEIINYRKDRSKYWLDLEIMPIHENGAHVGFLALQQDITELKDAFFEIVESEKRFKNLVNNLSTGVLVQDKDTRIELVNEAASKILGVEEQELVGKTSFDESWKIKTEDGIDYDKEQLPVPSSAKDKVSRTQQVLQVFNEKEQEWKWLMVNAIPRIDQKGEVENIICTISDIGHLKKSESLIYESEQKFRKLSTELNVGILLQGLNDEILFSNDAALDLLGLSEEQLLGKTSFDPDWKVIHEDGSPFLPDDRPSVKTLKTGQKVVDVPMGVYRPGSKDWVWLMTSAVPLYDIQGELKSAIVSLTDYTKNRKYEEELISSIEEKNVLLKEIHHRVKNSLQLISSMIYLKTTDWKSPEASEFMSEISQKINSVSLVHERLLQSERLDSIELSDYVEKLIQDLESSNNSRSRHIIIESEIEESYFTSEKAMYIGQLLNELVTNAIKHAFPEGQKGRIEIHLSSSGRAYRLTVSDNGRGMPRNIKLEKSKSYGMQLIHIFSLQLSNEFDMSSSSNGTRYQITFS